MSKNPAPDTLTDRLRVAASYRGPNKALLDKAADRIADVTAERDRLADENDRLRLALAIANGERRDAERHGAKAGRIVLPGGGR